ncbi:MAG: UvrB/UvrC motif-containing protein [Bacteroidetes bacterium]|nr:UvrB/UvrC motif-containing protein [Bacteroidota bacterium]
MFKKSGLPLEDSKVSRDKMAELATELNADLLILPYYGTSYDLGGFLDKNSFVSVGSFQIYSAKHNDFIARVDFDGTNYYCAFTKVGLIGSTTFSLIGGLAGSGAVAIVGAVIGIVPSLWAAINSFQNKDKRYNKAFIKGINKGMDVYFAKFPKQYVVETPVKKTNIEENNNVTQPKTNYEKFSLQELEDMKKKAVSEKDYSKAAEIKEEINKRNQK